MTTDNDRLEAGLRALDPLAGRDSEGNKRAGELLAAILANEESPAGDSGMTQPRQLAARDSSRWSLRLAVALPLAAVALLVPLVGLPGEGGQQVATLPALARAAEVAADQPPAIGDGRYGYLRTRSTGTSVTVAGGSAWMTEQTVTAEEWVGRDGSGQIRSVSEPARWAGPTDRKAWEAAGRPGFMPHGWDGHTERHDFPANRGDAPEGPKALLHSAGALMSIPTDPTELATWLQRQASRQASGFSVAVRTLMLAGELLSNPLTSPELRAALFRAEGLVPGIEYLGPVTDQLGRRGVAVGAESANSGAPTLYSLIFDPRTSMVLATQQLVRRAPSALPDEDYPRVESILFLESGGVNELGERPDR